MQRAMSKNSVFIGEVGGYCQISGRFGGKEITPCQKSDMLCTVCVNGFGVTSVYVCICTFVYYLSSKPRMLCLLCEWEEYGGLGDQILIEIEILEYTEEKIERRKTKTKLLGRTESAEETIGSGIK